MAQWTPEQARSFSVAGVAARKARSQIRARNRADITRLTSVSNGHATEPEFTIEVQGAIRARLRDLLAHLAELTARKSPDWSQVDRLASAIERIAELERQLDGRPLPGSRRPPREDAPSVRTAQRRGPAVPMPSPAQPAPSSASDDDEPPLYQPAPLD